MQLGYRSGPSRPDRNSSVAIVEASSCFLQASRAYPGTKLICLSHCSLQASPMNFSTAIQITKFSAAPAPSDFVCISSWFALCVCPHEMSVFFLSYQRDGRELGTFSERLIQDTFPSLDPRFREEQLPKLCWTSSPGFFPDSSGVPDAMQGKLSMWSWDSVHPAILELAGQGPPNALSSSHHLSCLVLSTLHSLLPVSPNNRPDSGRCAHPIFS